jgi:hypothetical protein
MTATAAQILQVRRMTGLVGSADYDDTAVQTYIERYPLLDERGELPYTWVLNVPPTQEVNPSWIATYDLAAAAADIWAEKASVLAADFDFSADGGSYTRSQAYEQAMAQSRYWLSRKSTKTIKQYQSPNPNTSGNSWVTNLPEGD